MKKKESDSQVKGETHTQRFDSLLTKLLAVPKEEVLRREAEYKAERASRKDGGGNSAAS